MILIVNRVASLKRMTVINFPELIGLAFLMGLGSTGHCLLMCGGISAALSSQLIEESLFRRSLKLLIFHLGRLSCYSVLGLVLGTFIQTLTSSSGTLIIVSRLLAAFMIIIMGLYIAGFSNIIKHVEKRMGFIWHRLQPITLRYMHMQKWHHAYLLGFIWGFLPCGMIYSTLLWASANNQGAYTALLMFSFGIGTLPALFASNFFSVQAFSLFQKKNYKRAIGILLIFFGIVSMAFIAMPHNSHQHEQQPSADHSGHAAHHHEDMMK